MNVLRNPHLCNRLPLLGRLQLTRPGICSLAVTRFISAASSTHDAHNLTPKRKISASAYVTVPVAQEVDESNKQFLDLEGDGSLEEEFEEERGRRSLASIFESEDEEVVEVNASLQDESLLIENCGLSDITVKTLHKAGKTRLFPIQKHVFDPAMEGRDLIGRAKTGSGKTLAFSLPVIEKLMKEEDDVRGSRRSRSPRCIVLAPTRELAKQVEREFADSAPTMRVACLYGGAGIQAQISQLRRGLDIVVGTPGRVIDLIDRGDLDLREIKFFILDEADMMLSQGFDEDVDKILETVPEERQTMLFSATMPSWVKRLTKQHLKNPVLVDLVGESNSGRLNEDINALAVQVEPAMRRNVLVDVLTVYNATGKAIVFTQTKRDADEVSAGIAQIMPCEALHGDMGQSDRERKLSNFRKGKFSVLVATDVAARGLDIPNVDLVLHYELPKDTETFLHRSGRTARAGLKGTTIALYTRQETQMLRRIIKEVGVKDLEIMGPPAPQVVMSASAKQVLRRLDNIDDDLLEFFKPAAKMVMDQSDPQDALCRALAAMSGLLEVPKPRSLLSQQEGYVTLRVLSRLGRVTKQGQVYTIIRNVLGDNATNDIGRIRMLPAEGELQGAAFDLPEEQAKALMENSEELTSRDFQLDIPKSLPLEEDRFGGRGGSFGGGRGGRGGGGRGGRDNYFSNRGGNNRSSGGSRYGNSGGGSRYGDSGSYGNSGGSRYGSSGGSSRYGSSGGSRYSNSRGNSNQSSRY